MCVNLIKIKDDKKMITNEFLKEIERVRDSVKVYCCLI